MKSPLIHLIIVCALLGITIVGYGFWYAAVEAKSAAVADLENQIVTKTETASRIASIHTSLAEIAGEEKIIQSYFVPETGVVAFINNLEAQGHTQGATVNVLSVSTSDDPTQPTLTFSLTIKGTFDAVMRTIGAIEYTPYDLSVSTLTLGEDGPKMWHADLTLLVGSVPTGIATSTP